MSGRVGDPEADHGRTPPRSRPASTVITSAPSTNDHTTVAATVCSGWAESGSRNATGDIAGRKPVGEAGAARNDVGAASGVTTAADALADAADPMGPGCGMPAGHEPVAKVIAVRCSTTFP